MSFQGPKTALIFGPNASDLITAVEAIVALRVEVEHVTAQTDVGAEPIVPMHGAVRIHAYAGLIDIVLADGLEALALLPFSTSRCHQ